MDANLFTAYNYLSSAIAQAFAALIALTAIFYIYRRGILLDQIKGIANQIRFLLVQHITKEENGDINPARFVSDASVTRVAEDLPEDVLEKMNFSIMSRFLLKLYVQRYRVLEQFEGRLKRLLILPTALSALAMLAGISALLFASILPCEDLRWGIMIGESALAAVALGWTVTVVIRMLKEPEEPQVEEGEE